jgi:hypothetical protein
MHPELEGHPVAPKSELDSTAFPLPVYVPVPAYGSRTVPEDVGPAIVIPTPYREEVNRLEQLRAQRAAVAREREHREEINRIRVEEERLDMEIAELERVRY